MTFAEQFYSLPIVGILRGIEEKDLFPLSECVKSSGLSFVEITMNTKNADTLISRLNELSENSFQVGAGTVVTMDELSRALNAGASYIVMPCIVEDIINYCVINQIPVFPGAFSPTEVYTAWKMGATMVKLFPASKLGPGYIKELKGPFDQIKLMATGGVNEENIAQYFKMGASAVAFGSGIFKNEWIINSQFIEIESAIRGLLKAFKNISI
ncbi:MAG: bifunctional 4-hydroxy-2-oxoglutarate aldolase/2-dehydro-3-deoxy-phosphogluconate aldolase [Bacteroidales bacterium]|nr:bifunctional 4-hydroxy-2-oxoglutarate aldolase/2-dehydro-3-deoxy-phosphogluconate aldolase [Bacteroidales bacterium]